MEELNLYFDKFRKLTLDEVIGLSADELHDAVCNLCEDILVLKEQSASYETN